MHLSGDQHRILAIKNSIREIGDYENLVKIEVRTFLGNRVFSYKIDSSLSISIIAKLITSIEDNAKQLDFEVLQVF